MCKRSGLRFKRNLIAPRMPSASLSRMQRRLRHEMPGECTDTGRTTHMPVSIEQLASPDGILPCFMNRLRPGPCRSWIQFHLLAVASHIWKNMNSTKRAFLIKSLSLSSVARPTDLANPSHFLQTQRRMICFFMRGPVLQPTSHYQSLRNFLRETPTTNMLCLVKNGLVA